MSRNTRGTGSYVVPGWNEYICEAHSEAREAFLVWQANLKPRQGPIADLMKVTRSRFKQCMRYCKSNEDRLRADSLARKLLYKDDISFWKDIKKFNRTGGSVLASTIDNVTGDAEIAQLWSEHYQNLLNSNGDRTHCNNVLNCLSNGSGDEFNMFTHDEIVNAVSKLKIGKSAGRDTLQSEHIVKADPLLLDVMLNLFNSMITHCHIPHKLMESVIVPILKDKKGQITDKNNYRPIAITSIFSKVLEILLLSRLNNHLSTRCNQFGFKSYHGTDMCVFTLKQIIEYYNSKSSPVYVCYLDASKAFDRINHWCLFKKLLKRGADLHIMKLLVFWYCHQTFCVRWGTIYSENFNVTNGVRQGGILSPMFFNVYMDDLSNDLCNSGIGCHMNGTCVNHLMYADDTCLIAPSPSALSKLLSICAEFATNNLVKFNELKTKCMCFKPRNLGNLHVPDIKLYDQVLSFVDNTKYLGVALSSDLTDDDDIGNHVRSIYIRGNMLVSRFRHCSHHIKLKLFKAYLANAYGCQLWCRFKKASMRKVIVAYNNVFRKLFNLERRVSISAMYVQNNVNSFGVVVRKSMYSFISRVDKSDNMLISCIRSSLFHKLSTLWKFWQDTLFLCS